MRSVDRVLLGVVLIACVASLAISVSNWYQIRNLDQRPAIRPNTPIQFTPWTPLLGGLKDPNVSRRINASMETAAFIDRNMPAVQSSTDRWELMKVTLSNVDPKLNGLYCEFGVAGGTSINFIASQVPAITIHGFDSFEGLPEDWRDGVKKGTFATVKLPEVKSNVQLYKGWFKDSLPGFKTKFPGQPMAFMHMDADLYASTKDVLEILSDRIVPGTVLQFDEFFNYPGWQNGESKAFLEFAQTRKVKFAYIGYSRDEQVAIKILPAAR